ncbi:prepilin peptidase [Nocardia thailandica]|uniref:Prepilin peptidase n=1 Tax=Nocardia thailandica TaxID=257275 RepID=A0ABW6PPE5_9NOCA|nr:prepilin peptidase [Nocardia thailandica]
MTTASFCCLAAWCLLLGVLDLHLRRLPNALTGIGALAVFGYAALEGRLAVAAVGALLLAVPYLLCHLLAPAALGAGDVKLAVALGAAAALAGPSAWVWAAVAAPLGTAVAAAVFLAHRWRAGGGVRALRHSPVPHGPAMCAATLAAIVAA